MSAQVRAAAPVSLVEVEPPLTDAETRDWMPPDPGSYCIWVGT